jgi:hypothetical protein
MHRVPPHILRLCSHFLLKELTKLLPVDNNAGRTQSGHSRSGSNSYFNINIGTGVV